VNPWFASRGERTSLTVHRQHSWDKLGRLKKGVFLAHRSVHRSEDETAFQFGEGYGREGRLRGEDSIAELCRREGIAQNLYYRWSKDFLESGKKRLAGDTARAATSDEVRICGGHVAFDLKRSLAGVFEPQSYHCR